MNGNGKGGRGGKARPGADCPEPAVPTGFAQGAGRGAGDRFRRYAVLSSAPTVDGDSRGRGPRSPGHALGLGTSSDTARAAVAARSALKSELVHVGYCVDLPLGDADLLHLHRRRLTAACRASLVAAVNASHIVGDDALCPTVHRGGVMVGDFWKVAPKFQLATPAQPLPLVVLGPGPPDPAAGSDRPRA